MAADHQPGDHHGQGAGQVEVVGQHESTVAACNPDEHQKHHDADPVVEQRLARDAHFEGLGHPGAPQDGANRDGIGRGNQGTEHQTPDERDRYTDRGRQQECPGAHQPGGEHHADRAQDAHKHPLGTQ